jgi:hypothetical protein
MSEAALQRARDRAMKAGRDRSARGGPTSTSSSSAVNDPVMEQIEAERRAYRERKAAAQSSAAGNTDSATMDGEDKLILKARSLQQENRDALANSIRVASEATQVGASTITKLNEQKEQMIKMDENLDATNESLTRSNRVIRGMKSLGGSIANFFSKPKEHQTEKLDMGAIEAQVRAEQNAKAASDRQASSVDRDSSGRVKQREMSAEEKIRLERSVGAKMANGKYEKFSSNDRESEKAKAALQEFEANKQVEDQQLDALGELMDTLKVQAGVMNTELKTHAVIINHLDGQIDKTSSRIQQSNREMKKIT